MHLHLTLFDSEFYCMTWILTWPLMHLPGQALLHVMEENMKAEAGARLDTPFFLVLLTDGKSQDDAIAAAHRLKNANVEIIAVGEKEEGLMWCRD